MAALIACGEGESSLPPLSYETEHAIVGVAPAVANPLCGGDLRKIDDQLEFATMRLGTERSGTLSIYILDRGTPCSNNDAVACYSGSDDSIYGPWGALAHELVHAASTGIAFPELAWSEANACLLGGNLLGGNRTNKDPSVTLDPSYFDRTEFVNYATLHHFARYLVETRGWEPYLRAIRGENIVAVYGESLGELTAAYEAEAPFSYPALNPCPDPPLQQIAEDAWAEAITVDCAEDDATQFEFDAESRVADAAVKRTVTLDEGVYAFVLTGGSTFSALRCQLDVLDEPISDPFAYDIRIEGYGLPNEFAGGEEHRLRVAAGTYLLTIASGTLEPVTAELSITRVAAQ